MTTAVYYRVSTDDQTLESQRVHVEGWLASPLGEPYAHNVTVYKDVGISGTSLKRPGFQKMLRDAEKGRVKTVIVFKMDRLTRTAITAISVILRFDEIGVQFISTTQPQFSHGMPFRHAIIAIFAELAQMERDGIVERVRSGMAAARLRGVKFGAPLKATEAKAAEAVALRQQGLTYVAIAERIGLSVGSVHKMLKQGILNDE